MTPEQINLVQSTFEMVKPIASDAAALFYRRLFEREPELRHLFPDALRAQGQHLMQMIGIAVANLDGIERIKPTLELLGRRHVSYGVEDAHYDAVGDALLATLHTSLGFAFTADARAAWAKAYLVLASMMKTGAAKLAFERSTVGVLREAAE